MKNKLLNPQSLNTDVATLFLRLIFGGLFVYYGYQKVVAFNDISPNFPDLIGIGGKLSFILVIFAELGCGLFVLVGFLTRLTIIPIFITMFVAYFIAHANDPFTVKQIAFVYLLLAIVIFVLGSGKYSIDNVLFKNKDIATGSIPRSI